MTRAVEPALAQELLQPVEELLAALLAARALRVARGAGVHADENLSLGLRHGPPPRTACDAPHRGAAWREYTLPC